ncbi:hypothetical protein IFM89_021894 [Coptis chinensis]|uniref:Pentatricopeptide repeat-containing protein n=1 Tax=Coptis chinensis TaxID=261450 RepID=A0A835HEE7_9MAGN|nr:hypothetical protein IFM89_021894 [Coptis chinensis]
MVERDIVSWNSIIVAFSELGDEENAVGIHGYVVKAGLDKELTVCNALVDVYGKCGKLEASKMVFDEMIERNVVSWSAIIAGFAHNGHAKYALNMFRWMVAGRRNPTQSAVSSLLPVLVELELLIWARRFMHMKKHRLYLIKWRRGPLSRGITMIANFAQNRLEAEAIRLVSRMKVHGECPDSVTLTKVLPACARIGSIRQGKEIHGLSIRLRGCIQLSERCSESVHLFSEMRLIGLKHDTVSFLGALSACANLNAIKQGKEIHGLLISNKDVASWNTMILGYRMQGEVDVAINLFEAMRNLGLHCNSVSL